MSEEIKKTTELTDEQVEAVAGGAGSGTPNVKLPLACALEVCDCSTKGNVTVYGTRIDEKNRTVYDKCVCNVCGESATVILEPDGTAWKFRMG